MLFNTLEFVLFLPVAIIGYFLLPYKFRWIFLLAASYYFYMCWKPEYIILIVLSTLIDYFCGLKMGQLPDKRKRRPYLLLSLVTNLGLLMGFKYFNFFSESAEQFIHLFDASVQLPLIDFLLPVGISFYTFQTLSYSIDVYRGNQPAEKHPGYFALYVSFFPQLVAGPIERFSSLSPQLKAPHSFTYDNLKNGLRLILFGLFAKMVLADNFAPLADQVFDQPDTYGSAGVASGMLFYAFQIYGDFYGYSLIAIGSARIMGISLMDNFRSPYLATGIADFWRRWHISLSTWFQDYVFLPMGGSRVGNLRWAFNILVVFLISGLWHGANWTFVAWGLCYVFLYLIEKGVDRVLKIDRKVRPLTWRHVLLVVTTFMLVVLTWTFFRSPDIHHAFHMFDVLFRDIPAVSTLHQPLFSWTLLGVFVLLEILLYNTRYDRWVDSQHWILRWAGYTALIFAILVFSGVEDQPFIYFQF